MRLLNILVIAALILAASFVYKIKFEFDPAGRTRRQVARRAAPRTQRDRGPACRMGKLDTPGRIQGLAERHLALQPVKSTQFDKLERLPERPPAAEPPAGNDPIGAMLSPAPETTGSVLPPPRR